MHIFLHVPELESFLERMNAHYTSKERRKVASNPGLKGKMGSTTKFSEIREICSCFFRISNTFFFISSFVPGKSWVTLCWALVPRRPLLPVGVRRQWVRKIRRFRKFEPNRKNRGRRRPAKRFRRQ